MSSFESLNDNRKIIFPEIIKLITNLYQFKIKINRINKNEFLQKLKFFEN